MCLLNTRRTVARWRERGFLSAGLIQILIYAAIAAALAGAAWAVYAGIKGKGYAEAEGLYKPQLEAVTKDRDDTRKKYDDFARRVEEEGKAQAARAAEIDAENARREKERKADYDKRIAALIADNQRLVARVRDHFARSGADRGPVPVPGDASPAGAPGRGSADDVPDLRRALEGLTRDCAVTTSLFLECRDAWKGIAR